MLWGKKSTRKSQSLRYWAEECPDDQEWPGFNQRITDLIVPHQTLNGSRWIERMSFSSFYVFKGTTFRNTIFSGTDFDKRWTIV